MIAIEKTKTERGKLLAAVLAIVMVVCAFAAITADDTSAVVTGLPDADEDTGVITLTKDTTVSGTGTITNAINLGNYTLKISEGANVTINYAFTAAGQHVIDFGSNGKIIVEEGATLTINASNGTVEGKPYVPTNSAGNSVFAGATTTGYTSNGTDAAIQVNGTMNVKVAADVKGNTNQAERTIYVTGTFNSDSNGYATTMFLINGGKVDVNLNDGSLTGYVDVSGEGASFEIGGTNVTGSKITGVTYEDSIFNIFAMNVGEGASATIDGKAQILDREVTSPPVGTISTITNNGNVAITKDGQLAVPEDTAFTNEENGTTLVDGILNLNGTFTGSITGSGSMTGVPEIYPYMSDNFIYNPTSGYSYVVQHYIFNDSNGNKITYQFGLAINTITYDGTPIWIDELSVIPISLQMTKDQVLTFTNTSSTWYDPVENDTYTGWLRDATENGNAGTYERVVQYECSLTSADKNLIGSSVTKIIGLTVMPGKLNVDVSMEGWVEGEAVKSPSTIVTTTAGVPLVDKVDYTVEYTYYTDEKCTIPITKPLEQLGPDTYYVKATVTPLTKNFLEGTDSTDFTVAVFVIDSEVSFHPLQDLNDNELEKSILGVDPDDIQKSINFDSVNEAIAEKNVVSGKVTGTLYKITNADTTWTTLTSKFDPQVISNDYGYFLAFYVQSEIDDISLAEITATITTSMTPEANLIVDITPVKNTTEFKFYVMYIADLQADVLDVKDPVEGQDELTYKIDFDGTGGADTGKYGEMTYDIDLSFLNMYIIVLNDYNEETQQNFTITDYRVDGARYTLINGAGDNFAYWATEDGSAFPSYNFGSVMIVGKEFDPDTDGIINLYAVYGSTPVEPVETDPATEVFVSMYYDGDKLVITVSAVEGYIPAGELKITGSYVSEFIDVPGFGLVPVVSQIPETFVDVEKGKSVTILTPEDYGFIGSITALDVTYSADDGSLTASSNHMTFEYTVDSVTA